MGVFRNFVRRISTTFYKKEEREAPTYVCLIITRVQCRRQNNIHQIGLKLKFFHARDPPDGYINSLSSKEFTSSVFDQLMTINKARSGTLWMQINHQLDK